MNSYQLYLYTYLQKESNIDLLSIIKLSMNELIN